MTGQGRACMHSTGYGTLNACTIVQEQNGDAGVQEPVSPDQVDIGLNSAGGPGNAHADQQQGSQPQQPDDEFVKKKAKYCCCIIM